MGKFLQFFLFKQLLAAKGDDTICMKRQNQTKRIQIEIEFPKTFSREIEPLEHRTIKQCFFSN